MPPVHQFPARLPLHPPIKPSGDYFIARSGLNAALIAHPTDDYLRRQRGGRKADQQCHG
jgi:hypothetical protein